jgi:hypothetical protein
MQGNRASSRKVDHNCAMMTFEAFSNKMGYTAYTVQNRQQLLQHFKPKFDEVVCHHVTVQHPAKKSDPLPPPVHDARVVGYAEEDGLEALVVELNGSTKRPDGHIFHITLSLDRTKGKKPFHSKDLLARGWKHVTPVAVQLHPEFLY